MTDEERISRRYRELPREEPPRHLDDAILAAARRAVHTRPAPLVVPSGRQRWYFPLAAAAIIVLAVAVTVHMDREQPAEEMLSSSTVTAPAAAQQAAPPPPAAEPAAPASPRRFEMRDEARAQKPAPAPSPSPAPSSDERAKREAAPAELLKAPEPASPPVVVPQAAPPPSSATTSEDTLIAQQAAGAAMGRVEAPKASAAKRRLDEDASSGTRLAASVVQSPEQWLQGIADLRRQGRHEEADKELAEFRKRYPKYQISPQMRKQVEKS